MTVIHSSAGAAGATEYQEDSSFWGPVEWSATTEIEDADTDADADGGPQKKKKVASRFQCVEMAVDG